VAKLVLLRSVLMIMESILVQITNTYSQTHQAIL